VVIPEVDYQDAQIILGCIIKRKPLRDFYERAFEFLEVIELLELE
jgi:hypothetical protein